MKYILKLISPGFKNMRSAEFKTMMFRYWFPTLSLPMIAALTDTEKFDIKFCDELFDSIEFTEQVDLVGITGMTAQINRAYVIADKYREKGVPVIIGGIHASVLPNEAKLHADSVMIGESESTWGEALEDFLKGELKPFYKNPTFHSLGKLPNPDRSFYEGKVMTHQGTMNSVQTTRGCPFDCDFCSVSEFFGKKFRTRPIDEVIAEIETLDGSYYSFIDDNIVGDATYSLELFSRLEGMNIKWTGQASITIASNEKLLDACAKSGCNGLLIGIESVNEKSLKSVNKIANRVDDYRESIDKIQSRGINILGSFIFGLEDDDSSVFENTLEFIYKSKLAVPVFNILTPYPGTRVYNQLVAENRIISTDWGDYSSMNVVYRPSRMTPEELHDGYRWAYQNMHSNLKNQTRAKFPLIF